ncbi:MAG: 30S ribosomal protein S1 [Flavobacteriales bacterium]|nr:30S ribosomal protein S1 [Flavobacteriales bacterium]
MSGKEKEENAEFQAETTTVEEVKAAVSAEKVASSVESLEDQLKNFNWDMVGKDVVELEAYTTEERAALEEEYEGSLTSIEEKEILDGKIVLITNKEVVINIGYKSDGIIPLTEFRYNPELKAGDIVEVYIENREDKLGQLILSHKKARTLKAWRKLNEVLETGEIITGHVKCRTKGGLIVDAFGIESFLPGSQIDVKPIRDYDDYVGRDMEFKVVKINQEYRNIVVSHKALIQAELEKQKLVIMSNLEKGQVLEGTVKNITSYGVFIDLGGVDGLVHITDLSWGRVNHPEELVELDQKVNVVILDFDDKKKRIALGMKQLSAHPWDALDTKIKVGDTVKGKVVVLADYGAFLEVAPGVEGLIHVSEMSWSHHLSAAKDFFKIGDIVDAQVLTLDRDERKMSLGTKQLAPDPWKEIEKKYTIDSEHTVTVRNFTNFGIFVELEEGIDGLVHISDLSWTKKIKHPSEFIAVGEQLKVKVLEVDSENRRLSLGHKQLETNPWDAYEDIFKEGSIHTGKVVEVLEKGARMLLQEDVEAFIPTKHLLKEDGSVVKLGESIAVRILEFSKDSKKIIASHSRSYSDDVEDVKAKGSTPRSDSKGKVKGKSSSKDFQDLRKGLEKTTLGDLEALSSLKEGLEKAERGEKDADA